MLQDFDRLGMGAGSKAAPANKGLTLSLSKGEARPRPLRGPMGVRPGHQLPDG